jgi:hypothetical protein
MDIKITLDEFIAMLDKLRVSHMVEKINNEIFHIKIIKDNNMFTMKFVDKGLGFEFANFYEGYYTVTR